MKKFFAILLGIVDVFCVGLIFYPDLSPHPPAHLGCFPGRRAHRPPDRAGIFRRTQEESPELPPPQRLIPL